MLQSLLYATMKHTFQARIDVKRHLLENNAIVFRDQSAIIESIKSIFNLSKIVATRIASVYKVQHNAYYAYIGIIVAPGAFLQNIRKHRCLCASLIWCVRRHRIQFICIQKFSHTMRAWIWWISFHCCERAVDHRGILYCTNTRPTICLLINIISTCTIRVCSVCVCGLKRVENITENILRGSLRSHNIMSCTYIYICTSTSSTLYIRWLILDWLIQARWFFCRSRPKGERGTSFQPMFFIADYNKHTRYTLRRLKPYTPYIQPQGTAHRNSARRFSLGFTAMVPCENACLWSRHAAWSPLIEWFKFCCNVRGAADTNLSHM